MNNRKDSVGKKIYDKSDDAIVALYRKGVAGTSVGTGFCVDITDSGDVLILTAAHVILQQEGVNVDAPYNNDIYAMFTNAATKDSRKKTDTQELLILLGCDVSADVALMCTTSHRYCCNQQCLKFNSKPFYTGDDCYNISTPLNLLRNNISAGVVRNNYVIPYSVDNLPPIMTPKKNTNGALCLMTDTAVEKGSSGSPFINNDDEVIGMAQWKFLGTDSFAGGVQSSFLKPIMNKLIYLNKGSLKNPSTDTPRIDFNGTTGKGSIGIDGYINVVGDLLIQLSGQNEEYKKSKYNNPIGIYITSVIPGGSIDQIGIVPGDIITRIDGKEITISGNITDVLLDIYFKRKETIKIEYIHFIDLVKMTVENKTISIGNAPLDGEYIYPDDQYELIDSAFTVGPDSVYIIYAWLINNDNTTNDKTTTLRSERFQLSPSISSTTFNYDITINRGAIPQGSFSFSIYLHDIAINTYTLLTTLTEFGNTTGSVPNINAGHLQEISIVKNVGFENSGWGYLYIKGSTS